MLPKPSARYPRTKRDLKGWMKRVLEKSSDVERDFDTGSVHDLRVALRHCRSIALGLESLDPAAQWARMNKAAKKLLRGMGGLRDADVIEKTAKKLGMKESTSGRSLLLRMERCAKKGKRQARKRLRAFDRKQWRGWTEELPGRAAHLRMNSPAAELIVLKRWNDAWERHQAAMQSRSKTEIHQLRIGLKRLRYSVESFLPARYVRWRRHLQKLQDLLGDVHDLDVLQGELAGLLPAVSKSERKKWRAAIQARRTPKLREYREKMSGPKSRWREWRSGLPEGENLDRARATWMGVWAGYLDPDTDHSQRVSRLAVGIYDGLAAAGLAEMNIAPARSLLEAAALARDAGRSYGEKHHRKATYKLILKQEPPHGWTFAHMEMIAQIARYRRGSLPDRQSKTWAKINREDGAGILLLSGILRLASALANDRAMNIARLRVRREGESVTIRATGYREIEPFASHVAEARHLLEIELNLPVLVTAAPNPTSV